MPRIARRVCRLPHAWILDPAQPQRAISSVVAGTLISGPGNAKHELESYLRRNRPELAAQVDTGETVEHPGEAALIASARSRLQTEA